MHGEIDLHLLGRCLGVKLFFVRASIKYIFKTLGMGDSATEHSPRRGGCGFQYLVLNEDILYIRDILGHANTQETVTYVGINDRKNSYVSQGYSACNSGSLR